MALPEDKIKPLICEHPTSAIRVGTKLARLMEKLHDQKAIYHIDYGMEPRRTLRGCGRFEVERKNEWLNCRVFGELFRQGPFEFVFHKFWLTRRGMILAAYDLVQNRPPDRRSTGELFIHFPTLGDESLRKEATALLPRISGSF